jgi:hypothetical protein
MIAIGDQTFTNAKKKGKKKRKRKVQKSQKGSNVTALCSAVALVLLIWEDALELFLLQ